MRDLLETIVKGIVNHPDEVSVEVRESVDFPGLTILEITVADSDKGILIGRRGRTINAIRDLMTISAIRNEKKIKVLVNEDRDNGAERESVSEVVDERTDADDPSMMGEDTPDMNDEGVDPENMLDDEL